MRATNGRGDKQITSKRRHSANRCCKSHHSGIERQLGKESGMAGKSRVGAHKGRRPAGRHAPALAGPRSGEGGYGRVHPGEAGFRMGLLQQRFDFLNAATRYVHHQQDLAFLNVFLEGLVPAVGR